MSTNHEEEPDSSTVELAAGAPDPDSSLRVRQVLEQGTVLAERYRIVRLLGQGAMGSVYQASDEVRSGLAVAIKLLAVQQPQALYRLKNEFRALAETVHPNLVGLHALGVDARGWFVVMDLVAPCTDFLSYVCSATSAFDEPRLRAALTQLLRGVAAIHAAGKLHRDLKPSNVLITREGRLVIADFGLVGDQEPGGQGNTREGTFAGTPAYAAPEQVRGFAVGPKADMYQIGVLLFEALTGRLPIDAASSHELLDRKTRESSPDLRTLAPDLPHDLSLLCNALLRRDPALRPDAAEALAQLDEQPLLPATLATVPFMAREAELSSLCEAELRAQRGAPVVAVVAGPSGIGKTALVTRFLELLRAESGTVALHGRCHAREQVPYNAFDSLIDALGRYLTRLAPVEAASLMPRDVALLARLFPTLLRVPAVLQMPLGREGDFDEGLLRPRAFAALKELLARIADRSSLVLCFDDLQWSDDDSRELLRDLLRSPGAPSCLCVCVLRSGDGSEGAVHALLRALPGASCIDLALAPLQEEEASALARAVLGSVRSEAELRLVVEEAAGSPFLLKELSRAATFSGKVVGLRETVAATADKLDGDARTLLELTCVAGRPIELRLAMRAARVAPQALPAVLATALLRTGTRGSCEYLESSHDRICDAVIQMIDEVRCAALHELLAAALADEQAPDSELIAHHLRAAGRIEQATAHTIAAAERAARTLAFGRSIELYRQALAEVSGEQRDALELALANAYQNLGRLNDAAGCYERAAQGSVSTEQQRKLASRAMLLYLLAGQIARGFSLTERLCRELGVLVPPRWPWLATLVRGLLLLRYLLGRRLSALPVPDRVAASPAVRERLELCFRATQGLYYGRPDASVHFGLLSMIGARRHRDLHHWPVAVVTEVLWHCFFHAVASERYERDLARAFALAEAGGDEEIIANVLAVTGICEMTTHRFQAALSAFERAEQALTARGRSAIQIFYATRTGRLISWTVSGHFGEVLRHCDVWIKEAQALGDHYGELMIRELGAHRFLALDAPEDARTALTEVRATLGSGHTREADPWWFGDVALYEGNAEAAFEADARARRSRFYGSVQRLPVHRVWCGLYRARASLMAAERSEGSLLHMRNARREAQRLARERGPVAAAALAHVQGSLAFLQGDTQRARTELERAIALYVGNGMRLHEEALRFRLGALCGGDEGAQLTNRARVAATGLGVRNPERWFRSLAPGFPDRRT